MGIKYLFVLIGFFACFSAHADVEHTLLRRLAVFPIAGANVSTGEDAWWQMREILTKDQRFFVASRRFMINRGVFQARKNLKPADVIILSKILDAQALIVSFMEERTLHFLVYDGENGYLLWESQEVFHPAMPIADQLVRISSKLVTQFEAAIPYQGFQVVDEVIGRPVYEQNEKRYAHVNIGNNSQIKVGDQAQWIQVTGNVGEAFFNSTAKITVVAEGKVDKIQGQTAIVELEKIRDLADLKENSLVRFPMETDRLKDMFTNEDKISSLSNEYLSSELKNANDFKEGHNATVSALAWIVNIAGFILIAF